MQTAIKKYESEFKRETIAKWIKEKRYDRVFCIESEDTVPGFPDTLCHVEHHTFHLYEFKVSDDKGDIQFKKTQPAFYLKNSSVPIRIIAYDNRNGKVHDFSSDCLFISGHVYAIRKSFKVRLPE